MFFKKKPKENKVIMAKFIYESFYHPRLNELAWQETNEKELDLAMKNVGSIFSGLIKLGDLYQPNRIIQGFEVKKEKDE